MIPYEAPLILRLLRRMPDVRLKEATPPLFQTWPAQVVIPGATIAKLIRIERERRGLA